jgi:hypothetical protein
MTTPYPLTPTLAQMPALAELFRLFLSGKHLNRLAEPVLWAELEKHEASYAGLFAALGFELRVDVRGFAWFHSADASSNIGKISRQLALLFMVIFDAQANAGKALQRFTDWLIDREWLAEVHEQQKDLLDAEGLEPDALVDLLGRASTLGFVVAEPVGWRLLPAVCRYLDHFEGLASAAREDSNETDTTTEDDTDDAVNDEESN